MRKLLPPHPETNHIIILHGDMKSLFLITFLVQNLITLDNLILQNTENVTKYII